jgi:hypothetical protein
MGTALGELPLKRRLSSTGQITLKTFSGVLAGRIRWKMNSFLGGGRRTRLEWRSIRHASV